MRRWHVPLRWHRLHVLERGNVSCQMTRQKALLDHSPRECWTGKLTCNRLENIGFWSTMEPAMFSVASMFDPSSSEDEDEAETFLIRDHEFAGMVLHIREFALHQVNANLLWPGAVIFADWIVEHNKVVRGRRILQLSSGTGALAIFLKKTYELDITTSDYDDVEIENNIRLNCELNDLACLPHISHTWGERFPEEKPSWDLTIASDILLYVKQYANLIKTLDFLFRKYKPLEPLDRSSLRHPEPVLQTMDERVLTSDISKQLPVFDPVETEDSEQADVGTIGVHHAVQPREKNLMLPYPCFLMSWRRRIPKEDEAKFFEGCRNAGFVVDDLGSRVYCIYPVLTLSLNIKRNVKRSSHRAV